MLCCQDWYNQSLGLEGNYMKHLHVTVVVNWHYVNKIKLN